MFNEEHHFGRSFGSQRHCEERCPCPKQPCGLVTMRDAFAIECPEHSMRTLRQSHDPAHCVPLNPKNTNDDDQLTPDELKDYHSYNQGYRGGRLARITLGDQTQEDRIAELEADVENIREDY